ncbi:MAG: type II toxin-antitoxin system RelE/ParE family toxin [Kofleriaceae bacterium]
MRIYFAPQAEDDFSALVMYIAERNPTAASELGNRIFAVIDKLARREFQGPEQA